LGIAVINPFWYTDLTENTEKERIFKGFSVSSVSSVYKNHGNSQRTKEISLPYIRHCESPLLPFGGEAIPSQFEIASGKKQERPRNDGIYSYLYGREKEIKICVQNFRDVRRIRVQKIWVCFISVETTVPKV
jgi:hypothetical protein